MSLNDLKTILGTLKDKPIFREEYPYWKGAFIFYYEDFIHSLIKFVESNLSHSGKALGEEFIFYYKCDDNSSDLKICIGRRILEFIPDNPLKMLIMNITLDDNTYEIGIEKERIFISRGDYVKFSWLEWNFVPKRIRELDVIIKNHEDDIYGMRILDKNLLEKIFPYLVMIDKKGNINFTLKWIEYKPKIAKHEWGTFTLLTKPRPFSYSPQTDEWVVYYVPKVHNHGVYLHVKENKIKMENLILDPDFHQPFLNFKATL